MNVGNGAQQRLEKLLLEGLEQGEPFVADYRFWSDLKAEALAQMEARRKEIRRASTFAEGPPLNRK